eukprot:8237710-Pyramimonas_sp.AAC.2
MQRQPNKLGSILSKNFPMSQWTDADGSLNSRATSWTNFLFIAALRAEDYLTAESQKATWAWVHSKI